MPVISIVAAIIALKAYAATRKSTVLLNANRGQAGQDISRLTMENMIQELVSLHH